MTATRSSGTYLFGGSKHWSPLEWTSSDDRVRGGSSQSFIDASPFSPVAIFYGNLDTKTLGGAGFASQRTTTTSTWDLSNYDGILLDIEKTDGKKYTLTLKDEILPKSPNGREQSTISWEYDFGTEEMKKHGRGEGGQIFVPWEDLVPTYRGREKKDVEPLNLMKVKRFSLMMRRCVDLVGRCIYYQATLFAPTLFLWLGARQRQGPKDFVYAGFMRLVAEKAGAFFTRKHVRLGRSLSGC